MMRRPTALALVGCGALVALAANTPFLFLNLKYAGLALVFAGLAGLRAPRRPPGWVRAHRERLRQALERFASPPLDEPRVPLDAILHAETGAGTARGERG
jgi:hypothetical protein